MLESALTPMTDVTAANVRSISSPSSAPTATPHLVGGGGGEDSNVGIEPPHHPEQ
jgi:hypothetical protein